MSIRQSVADWLKARRRQKVARQIQKQIDLMDEQFDTNHPSEERLAEYNKLRVKLEFLRPQNMEVSS